MKIRNICTVLLLVSFAMHAKGQAFVYTYDTQGNSISRIYTANDLQKEKGGYSAEKSKVKVNVSPTNTFDDQIKISVTALQPNGILSYVMADMSGYVMFKGTLGNEDVTLSTLNLAKGIYMLRISGDNYKEYYKLLKE